MRFSSFFYNFLRSCTFWVLVFGVTEVRAITSVHFKRGGFSCVVLLSFFVFFDAKWSSALYSYMRNAIRCQKRRKRQSFVNILNSSPRSCWWAKEIARSTGWRRAIGDAAPARSCLAVARGYDNFIFYLLNLLKHLYLLGHAYIQNVLKYFKTHLNSIFCLVMLNRVRSCEFVCVSLTPHSLVAWLITP